MERRITRIWNEPEFFHLATLVTVFVHNDYSPRHQSADMFCRLGALWNKMPSLVGALRAPGTSPASLSVSLLLFLLHDTTKKTVMTMATKATDDDVKAIPRDFLFSLLNPPSTVQMMNRNKITSRETKFSLPTLIFAI